MKIEALESIKSDGFILDAGDVKQHVPEDIGISWCAMGWAKDIDGRIPTGERKVVRVGLEVMPGVAVSLVTMAGE